MDILQIGVILAQQSFGSGIAVGFGSGLATGIGVGMGSGQISVRKKIERQLRAAVESGEISIVDKEGQPITPESLLVLLKEKFEKA